MQVDEPAGSNGEDTGLGEPAAAPIDSAKRTRWSTTTKVISAAIAIVGAATGAFSIVQALTRDVSSFDTLVISASAVDVGEREFALPLTQIGREDFPSSTRPCSAEQLEWLRSNARELDRRLRVDMRNVAGEGAMLALIDFRSAPERETTSAPLHVLVSCPAAAGTSIARAALLRVDLIGDTAHFRPTIGEQGDSSLPDIPVSWNLAPGESGTIDIKLTARQQVSGSLVVTVLSGREEAEVLIQGAAFDVPGLWEDGDVYLTVGESGMECVKYARGVLEACSDADLTALADARDAPISRS